MWAIHFDVSNPHGTEKKLKKNKNPKPKTLNPKIHFSFVCAQLLLLLLLLLLFLLLLLLLLLWLWLWLLLWLWLWLWGRKNFSTPARPRGPRGHSHLPTCCIVCTQHDAMIGCSTSWLAHFLNHFREVIQA